jgi:putative tryptophan/tyrosine transport system substrate-binding protein
LLPGLAIGQQKTPRIGYLSGSSASSNSPRRDAFRQGLRELGYVEGQNIAIEYRYAEGNLDRMPDLAGELIRLGVDVIVSGTEQGIRAAQKATKTIPIIVVATGDPVGSGFAASLAQPGANITGTTSGISSDRTRKQVELLKEAVPQPSHLAVFWNPGNISQKQRVKEIELTAKTLDVKLQPVGLERPGGLDEAFSVITKERPNGLFILRSPIVRILATRITEFADKNRLPTMYADSQFVESGGLMSYAPDILALDRRTGIYVDKILKGARPADLPIEEATKFEFVINLKTAKAIGLAIPDSVLSRADKVIK